MPVRLPILFEIRQAWRVFWRLFSPLAGCVLACSCATSTTQPAPAATRQMEAEKAVSRMVLAKVEFREVPLGEAMDFLIRESKRLDPKGRGIRIIYDLDVPYRLDPRPREHPATSKIREEFGNVEPPRITVSLGTTPLVEALRYVTGLANLGFRIRPDGVHVVNRCTVDRDSVLMQTREFRIPRDFVPYGEKIHQNDPSYFVAELKKDCRQFFERRGVLFPKGTTAALNRSATRLTVHNSVLALDFIDALMTPEKPAEIVPIPGPEVPKITERGQPLPSNAKGQTYPRIETARASGMAAKAIIPKLITREYLLPPKIDPVFGTWSREELNIPEIPGETPSPVVSPSISYLREERKLVVRHTEAAHAIIRNQIESNWRAYYAAQKTGRMKAPPSLIPPIPR